MKLCHNRFVFSLGSVLGPRRQHNARELRVRRPVAAQAGDWCQRDKDRALHRHWRRTKHDHVTELPRTQGELQWIQHTLAVCVSEPRKAVESFHHVHEPLAGCDLHPHPRIAVARIPPVMPYAELDDGRLALIQNTHLPVAFYCQLTLQRGEALDQGGMTVFPNDACPNERSQLGGRAARRIVPRTLQDRGAFPGDGVLPDFADFYRCTIRRAVRAGVRYAAESRIVDVRSAIFSSVRLWKVCPSTWKNPARQWL
jgi:hypothetical protein